MASPLLEIKNLSIRFKTGSGSVPAAEGISFCIEQGESLGIVGESGCGKSVTALSILRLLPSPPAIISADGIFWNGSNILGKSPEKMQAIRGKEAGMIFQEPLTSFNPVQTIGRQIAEVFSIHTKISEKDAEKAVKDTLVRMGFRDPDRQYKAYPHELSGGMRQRAMIAMAMILKPKLLIADEPTTALDVTIQAQILDLMDDLKQEYGMALLLITHNMAVVARNTGHILVLYAGRMAEYSPTGQIFKEPLHPYTQGLLASIPKLSTSGRLEAIPGSIPDPADYPPGCAFHPRCPHAMPVCREKVPVWTEVKPGRFVSCWLYPETGGAK